MGLHRPNLPFPVDAYEKVLEVGQKVIVIYGAEPKCRPLKGVILGVTDTAYGSGNRGRGPFVEIQMEHPKNGNPIAFVPFGKTNLRVTVVEE